MHVPTQIQNLIEHARALNVEERRVLRLELLKVAAGLGIPIQAKPKAAGSSPRLRWPCVGGHDLVVAPSMTFETEEFQCRWEASDVVAWIYALGCPGLQELGRLLGLPLFKPGTTETGIQARMAELGRDNYGGSYRGPHGLVREPGFGAGAWVAEQLPITLELSPLSPVHPGVRAVAARLPRGLTYAVFEQRFSAEVGKASLGSIIASTAGRARCAERGVDPARCRRVTEYRFGSDVRPSDEMEFTVFRPRSESDRLIVIAEKIIIEHVMGEGR